jgi:tetratricopeptide (TPR) repeat protein
MRSTLVLLALLSAAPAAAQDRAAAQAELARAVAQLDHGEYAAAEPVLRRLAIGATEGRAATAAPASLAGGAQLALARLYLETGRHDHAQRAAEAAGSIADLRIPGRAMLGEIHLARGDLDAAEAVLGEVAAEPGAHRARVFLGRALLRRGREPEARRVLMQVVAAYNDETIARGDAIGLGYVGMAAAMLGSPHDANTAFMESRRASRDLAEPLLERAALALSKFDTGLAADCVRDALAINPHSARAHALRARILLEDHLDFAGALAELDEALAVDPTLPMAHVTRAAIALRDMDLSAADRHLDAALATDPNDLEALSVRAAVRFVAEDEPGFDAAARAVLDRNPRYSTLYSIVADHADWEHRYPDVVELAREALRIDGDDARAHATLGLNLLRMGEEEDGLAALRDAWRRDRFDARVFNTLNFWDDVIGPQYEQWDARPFRFRMHREERPLIGEIVTTTLRAAWNDMRRRYGFTPRGPVGIELYASTRHFSVRTSGLPNVGVQGVCFGQVVTAISPRGGPFDWAQITTHELAHVFHIQMSRNRVPRWFTEGLAEHETATARPEWRREEDHRLALALDRLPPLRDLNTAFTHAGSAEDVMTAYYASSRVVAYLEGRFGWPALATMLRAWGDRHPTPDVVQRVLGVSIDDLDRDWRAHERTRLAARARDFAVDFGRYADTDAARARLATSPRDAAAQAGLAASLLAHGDASGATGAASEAIRIDPHQPIARFVLAQLAVARRDAPGAATHLSDLIASGHDGYEVRLLEARAASGRADTAAARMALEAAIAIDGDRPEAWQGLREIAIGVSDTELSLRALRRLVAIDQHDRESLAALLDLLHERAEWAELLAVAPRTLYADPERGRGRWLHGEALLHAGRAREALVEIDAALLAGVDAPGPVHLSRARALAALRRGREAREAAQRAAAADPSLAAQAAEVGR